METERLRRKLAERFRLADFRPGQAEAIQSLLAGRHVLVVMPTGAGKSLIYQLTGGELPGTTIVISPLIALMKDQTDALGKHGIPATFINSSIDGAEQSRRLHKVAAGHIKIVYIAPERLRNETFMKTVQASRVSLLAVDEAHCISQWGHDFRPDYMQIGPSRARLGNPTTVALTATATPKVQEDIIEQIGIPTALRIVTGFNRPNLVFNVHYCSEEEEKYEALQEFLASAPQTFGMQKGLQAPGIVYVGKRDDAVLVAEFVRNTCGIEALFYHGRMESSARSHVQETFMCGDVPIVVATNAFGMGIDRADLRFVVHFALPGSLEAYYQEAGRAGRDALPAQCVLLYCPKDRALQEWFIENEVLTAQEITKLFKTLLSRQKKDMVTLTDEDISQTTGLNAVEARTGLAQLELAGGIERLGDVGPLMRLRIGTLDPERLLAAERDGNRRRRKKEAELGKMISYAETNACRRKTILGHFGDTTEPAAEVCCDNCLTSKRPTPVEKAAGDRTLTETERIPLAILDAVRTLKWEAGREKLAQLLKGSRAADILRFGYHRSKYYGRLHELRLADIRDLIEQLTKGGYLKRVGGEFPVLRLAPPGEKALEARAAIPLKSHACRTGKKGVATRAGEETVETTNALFRRGLTPQQIAAQRSLTEETVYSHLARLIAQGKVALDAVVPRGIQEHVRAAIVKVGSAEYLSPIKAVLPESVTYNQLRCIRAALLPESPAASAGSEVPTPTMPPSGSPSSLQKGHTDDVVFEALKQWRRGKASARNLPAFCVFHDSVLRELASKRPKTIDALARVKGIGTRKFREYGRELLDLVHSIELRPAEHHPVMETPTKACAAESARSVQPAGGSAGASPSSATVLPDITTVSQAQASQLRSGATAAVKESVRSFLASAHPQPLAGNWNSGWALDFNSHFSGADWARTAVGDILFRYKYEGARGLVEDLAERLASLAERHPELKGADTIVPIPPSIPREFDPVSELCRAIGRRLGTPVTLGELAKTRSTSTQKNFGTLAQKHSNVAGAFAVPQEAKPTVKGKRLLLVDDLFDSGATLREATRALLQAGAASVNVMTVVKTIHSER